jgi:hypothetical protein
MTQRIAVHRKIENFVAASAVNVKENGSRGYKNRKQGFEGNIFTRGADVTAKGMGKESISKITERANFHPTNNRRT